MSMRIDTNTLNYYVQNAQISLSVLRTKINHLDQFLSGEKQPTFNQLSEIAKKINLTEKTFTRRFKKTINSSPIQYLKSLRVEKAKELLISTSKTLGEITIEVGYFDENSFRKLFKKETSLNPIEYRNRFKQTLTQNFE